MIGSFFGNLYDANIRPQDLIETTSIVCGAWRVIGEKKVNAVSVMDFPSRFKKNVYDDHMVVKKLQEVVADADVLLHQNGDSFDVKKLRWRCKINGLPSVGKVKSIDTLKQVRKWYYPDSKRLDFLARELRIGKKLETGGMDLWQNIIQAKHPTEGCSPDMDLCAKSVSKMVRYNKHDVKILIGVFEELANEIDSPFYGLYNDTDSNQCHNPMCRSYNVTSKGYAYTAQGRFRRYMCNDCGKQHQDAKASFRVHTKAA